MGCCGNKSRKKSTPKVNKFTAPKAAPKSPTYKKTIPKK